MSRSKVLFVAVVVALLAGGAGMAVAANGSSAPAARSVSPRAGGATTSHDLQFVPVNPCRLADTRLAGGALGNNVARSFLVTGGSGFSLQGGNSSGCGIPDGALAAELTIISADASGPGLLRAYPFGGQPTATILAYQKGPNLLNTGTIALCDPSQTSCTSDLTVKSFQASTQVIIDVNGYYVPNYYAFIDLDGSLISGAGVASSGRTTGVDTGGYTVVFDRDVTGCALLASPSDDNNQADIWARQSAGDPNAVELDVEAPATANVQQDNEVFLHVVC
jgi:hypothetical protein